MGPSRSEENLWSFPPERKRRTLLGILLVALGTAWTVFATDVLVESIKDKTGAILLFGRSLFSASATPEVLILAGLALTLGAVLTLALTTISRARRYRSMRSEFDRRWQELSVRHAGLEARHELLEWRIPELQRHVDTLHGKRDELLDEMGKIAEKTRALRELAAD